MKQKLFTLMTLLVLCVTGAWAQKSPQTMPTTVLDLETPTLVTRGNSGDWTTSKSISNCYYYSTTDKILVVSAWAAYQSKSKQTWTNYDASGSSNATWEATGVFKGKSYYWGSNDGYYAGARNTERNYNYLVTHCTGASALLINAKNTTSASIAAYEASYEGGVWTIGATPVKSATTEVGSTTPQIARVSGLDYNKNYLLVVYGSTNDNAQVLEVAFSFDQRKDIGLSFSSTSGKAVVTDGTYILPSLVSDPIVAGVTYSSSDTDVADFADNSVGTITLKKVGTTTITASYSGNEDNQPTTATFDLTVLSDDAVLTVSTETEIKLTKAVVDAHDYLSASNNFTSTTINDEEAYYQNLSNTDRYINIDVKGAKSFEIYLKNSNAGRTYVVQVGNNNASTLIHQAKVDDTSTDIRSSGLISCPSEITTIKLKGGGATVYPYKIVFYTTDVQATITAAGYASFSNAGAVTIPTGVEAYYMSAAAGTNATLTKIEEGVIPANTGVILKGDAGTYSFAGTTTTTTYDNKLVANLTTLGTYSYETAGYYILAAGPSFKESTGYTAGTPSTFLAAGKAFLPKANVDGGAHELSLDFGDVTAIKAVEAKKVENGVFYNLAGQKVAQPIKGLYIVNGKKVVLK